VQHRETAKSFPGMNLRRILVPIDFTTPSLVALDHAAGLAVRFASEVNLLHIVAPKAIPRPIETGGKTKSEREIIRNVEERLRRLAKRSMPASVPVKVHVDNGMGGIRYRPRCRRRKERSNYPDHA